MNNTSTNYFQEKLEILPDHLRWAIRDIDYIKALGDITRKYKLHIDQASTLELSAQRLMLGDIDAPGFIDVMFKEAYISSQVAADMLIDIDTSILRKIKEKIETFEREEAEVEQHRKEYLSDSEKEIDEMNTVYRAQDEEYVRVATEAEQELLKEGYLEDGSNINEEDLAKAYGMTVADFLSQNTKGGIQEARESENNTATPTPSNILSEKEDLLKELESPEKSFSKPLFTPIKKIETPPTVATKPVEPDHQLQNTHVEEPFHDEVNIVEKPTEEKETIEPPVEKKQPIQPTITPTIKKPAKIDLTHDVYREPIE
ncbi:MAG: hypothetical protein RJB39_693 [Candidatus Parcubacteria bacterium]|jgi:hypothetical protein